LVFCSLVVSFYGLGSCSLPNPCLTLKVEMYVTGYLQRKPGLTNIKMALGALASKASRHKASILWPHIPGGRHTSELLSIHSLFDLEATAAKMTMSRLPPTVSCKDVKAKRIKSGAFTNDLWTWVRRAAETPTYNDFMTHLTLAAPVLKIANYLVPKKPYATVHLRCEDDWKSYSKRRAKVVFWPPSTILKAAKMHMPSQMEIIYLVGGGSDKYIEDWSTAFPQKKVMCRIELLPLTKDLPETVQAALDFHVANHASWFMGHLHSSFSLEAIRDEKPHLMYPFLE